MGHIDLIVWLGQERTGVGETGAQFPGCRQSLGGAEKSHQCHKYFPQSGTFTSERSLVRTLGGQTCFLSRAPSNLVTPLGEGNVHQIPSPSGSVSALWLFMT